MNLYIQKIYCFQWIFRLLKNLNRKVLKTKSSQNAYMTKGFIFLNLKYFREDSYF